MSVPSPATTLHLGIFFDGTGNHLGNASNGDASNIAKLFAVYPHDSAGHHLSVYVEGIGTREAQPDSLFAMGTGMGHLGWRAAVERAQQGIAQRLQMWIEQHPGQTIGSLRLDVFGFSRGAACARHLANDVWAGIDGLTYALLRANPLIAAALPTPQAPRTTLRFLGLFDTVTAIKGTGTLPQLTLPASPPCGVVHLVAADELRHNFPLSSAGTHDLQLPGAHADIGGGYPPSMEEVLLLTRPDSSRVPIRLALERTPSYQRTQALLQAQSHTLTEYGYTCRVRSWQKEHRSNVRGDRSHDVEVYAAVEGRRQVRNDLARVYLEIMHHLALAGGVCLQPLPDFAYAAELLPVIEKIKAKAYGQRRDIDLDAAQRTLLYRRYIHRSGHWTTEGFSQNSDLDTLFVHRPEPSGKRRILLA